MKRRSEPTSKRAQRSQYWTCIVSAVIVFPFMYALWIMFNYFVPNPQPAHVEVESTLETVRWFGMPLFSVAVLFGGKWIKDALTWNDNAGVGELATQRAKEEDTAALAETARRGYVLEVLGLGVTYETYRQAALWNALCSGNPYTSIRERDPNKYGWSADEKLGKTGTRACDALENGARLSPMYWGVPTLYAGMPIDYPPYQPSEISPEPGLAGSSTDTGMAWHLFVTGPWWLSERPDQLLEKAFELFEAHPDLPYLVLLSNDDMAVRDALRVPGTPSLVRDGYYIPERPDASAVFVLARRERIESLRPYVWDDPDNDYLQENLRMMYCRLEENVPTPEKLAHPEKSNPSRHPTVAEWLQAAATFAKNPVFEDKNGHDASPVTAVFKRWLHHPPKDWKPTPWFPVPWNREQMETFDNLPSLGFVHRPVFVKFEDAHGKPITRRDQRQELLGAGWQQALATLSEAERKDGPARIVAAFDHDVDRLAAFEGMLHHDAAQGGPEIDTGTTGRFINTDKRLGNTGAATFFMQMALGVMGSYIEGGASAAVNLRDPAGASIVFISPPTEARRKAQAGRDVFKHRVQPSIDPDNYKPPTVNEVFGNDSTPSEAKPARS